MTKAAQGESSQKTGSAAPMPEGPTQPVARIKSQELLRRMREVEIDHEGRIYRLRLTRQNKLILTA